MVPLVTHGGEENLRLLRDGKVSLALAQGDAALAAYEGTGNFAADGPHPELRAVGSLYPEAVHVLVRADSPLASPADLRGQRVAVGLQGSASRTTALRVLEAHGVMAEYIKPAELSIGNALVALRQKEVDAVIQIIGAPADSIRDALTEIPLRLLPLSEPAVAALAEQKAGYFAYTIPRGSYAMQKDDIRTIATAAVLLAGSELSDDRGRRAHAPCVRERPGFHRARQRAGRAGFRGNCAAGAVRADAHGRRQGVGRHEMKHHGTLEQQLDPRAVPVFAVAGYSTVRVIPCRDGGGLLPLRETAITTPFASATPLKSPRWHRVRQILLVSASLKSVGIVSLLP